MKPGGLRIVLRSRQVFQLLRQLRELGGVETPVPKEHVKIVLDHHGGEAQRLRHQRRRLGRQPHPPRGQQGL